METCVLHAPNAKCNIDRTSHIVSIADDNEKKTDEYDSCQCSRMHSKITVHFRRRCSRLIRRVNAFCFHLFIYLFFSRSKINCFSVRPVWFVSVQSIQSNSIWKCFFFVAFVPQCTWLTIAPSYRIFTYIFSCVGWHFRHFLVQHTEFEILVPKPIFVCDCLRIYYKQRFSTLCFFLLLLFCWAVELSTTTVNLNSVLRDFIVGNI